MPLVAWVSESIQARVKQLLEPEASLRWVGSFEDFIAATRDPESIGIVDQTTAPVLDRSADLVMPGTILAICDDSLPSAVKALRSPYISHVTSLGMLDHPYSRELFRNVITTLQASSKPRLLDWLSDDTVGRRVRLTHASRRDGRLEKLVDFFTSNGCGSRTVQQLRDAAEELLTNAFYDAPVAGGAIKKPVSRTQDIELPEDSACDLAYGFRDDLAIVRVRDPFGSLTRNRLMDVLTRCSRTDMTVEVDETMGGAGLGMWRIFSAATFVAVSVVSHRHTEILVGIAKRATAGPKPFSFHLFFREGAKKRFWSIFNNNDDTNQPSLNQSVVIVEKSK